MADQLKEAQHRINLYRVETEELIKQIDLADAKTREKEDALVLREAEFERNLRNQEERILFRRGKSEEREILDIKREHGIQMEELRRTLDERVEEVDYLTAKVDKLEQTNKELRLAKDPRGEIKKLESEIAYLQSQLSTKGGLPSSASTSGPADLTKQLSLAEQVKL